MNSIFYKHAQQGDKASESGVTSQDGELIPELRTHHDRQEEDEEGEQREEVAHVLYDGDPKIQVTNWLLKIAS